MGEVCEFFEESRRQFSFSRGYPSTDDFLGGVEVVVDDRLQIFALAESSVDFDGQLEVGRDPSVIVEGGGLSRVSCISSTSAMTWRHPKLMEQVPFLAMGFFCSLTMEVWTVRQR